MIVVRHAEECSSKPVAGRLTGTCDCATAKLDQTALKKLETMIEALAEDSMEAKEDSNYYALRLEALAERLAQEALGVQRVARRADLAARKTHAAKKKLRS